MAGKRMVRRYTNIGERIASLDLNQAELGKMMRVSQQTVSKKLRGETAILLADLERLARKLGVAVGWFFKGYKGMPSAMPKAAR